MTQAGNRGYRCPGCQRDMRRHEYDLTTESCLACLEIIPRVASQMRGRVTVRWRW